MIHLDYRDARPIYAQITDGFREQIITGVLQPGEKLPSVRELATALTINPNTIQRSYRQLEAEGWVATVPGKGCFVCQHAAAQNRETEKLLRQLEELTAALTALGVSREEIAEHIRKEEPEHA